MDSIAVGDKFSYRDPDSEWTYTYIHLKKAIQTSAFSRTSQTYEIGKYDSYYSSQFADLLQNEIDLTIEMDSENSPDKKRRDTIVRFECVDEVAKGRQNDIHLYQAYEDPKNSCNYILRMHVPIICELENQHGENRGYRKINSYKHK